MGGKGQRRREKNYEAAHGGSSTRRLPPPPNPKDIEALPSKLRKLMHLIDPSKRKPVASAVTKERRNKLPEEVPAEKGTRKRKRKEVKDLRFQDSVAETLPLSRKARKKEYLEARKKKHKRTKEEEILNFPGHEEIKFGEVVEAPPKLSFPKVRKTVVDVCHERVRLQAIEAYRDRRGWVARPGIQLPNPTPLL